MKTKFVVLGAITLLFAACQDELQRTVNQITVGELTPLSIQVVANPETKVISGQVTETALPANSSIGITLVETDALNGKYDNNTYNNVEYKFTDGTAWNIVSGNVLLSATLGTVYGYYPYNPDVDDITAVPIKATDYTDYMYAIPETGIKNSNSGASLEMQHALSVVKFTIKAASTNGYTGLGKITNVKLEGSTLGAEGSMDITDGGAITAAPAALNYTTELSLTGTNSAEVFAVPTGTESQITFSVTMDNQVYTATTAPVQLEKGQQYAYTLNMSSTGLTVSQVNVEEWGLEQDKGTYDTNLKPLCEVTYSTDKVGTYYSVFVNSAGVLYQVSTDDTFECQPDDVIFIRFSDTSSGNYVKVDGNQGTLVEKWEFTFTATKQNHKIELHSGVPEIREIV
ncbi:MAG: fimbrillin family protein [Parabacteroides sp.]